MGNKYSLYTCKKLDRVYSKLCHSWPSLPSFFFLFNLFTFGCAGSPLLRMGLLQLQRGAANFLCSACLFIVVAPLRCRAQVLDTRASVVAAHGLGSSSLRALERGLSSCGSRAQSLCGVWRLSRPGVEAVFPALAGRFLTTVSPGTAPSPVYRCKVCHFHTDGPPWYLLLWSIHNDHLSPPFLPRISQCMHSTYDTCFSSSNMSSVFILTQDVEITKTETVDTFKFTFSIHLYKCLPIICHGQCT